MSRQRQVDLLVDAGRLSRSQAEKVLAVQRDTGEYLGKTLVQLGYLTEAELTSFYEIELRFPRVQISDIKILSEMLGFFPQRVAEHYGMFPISRQGKRLTVVMVDPMNEQAIEEAKVFSGLDIQPVIASETEILQAIDAVYSVGGSAAAGGFNSSTKKKTEDVWTESDGTVVGMVNAVIRHAVLERASDIHIEPTELALRIRFRIDGVLQEFFSLSMKIHASLVSRVKVMSSLDIAEKRLPQDGRTHFKMDEREIDLRVSIMPTVLGEKIVMRVLHQSSIMIDMEKLGFSAINLKQYRRMYAQPYGMILVTGPTGSGKTTTLYSTLSSLNTTNDNILTIEDPVEYRLRGVNQVQVNPKAGLNFAVGLRSMLRQDPNVMMVGEIRDGETANIAVRAALTGHRLLSTLHTNDAAGAVSRLIDMGVEPFLVASSLIGVLAQRLVRLICRDCKVSYHLTEHSSEWEFLGEYAVPGLVLHRGRGCRNCGNTGFRGRLAVHELLVLSEATRELINRRVSTNVLRAAASKEGMRTMYDDGVQKALSGQTTLREVMRISHANIEG